MAEHARDAIKDVSPVLLAVLPFGGVFGALAAESGLTLFQIMVASATIFAGASQYAMLDLMGQKVQPWAIVLTVFAINFRHVLYSAALGRRLKSFSFMQKSVAFGFLVDPLYAAAEARSRHTSLTPAYIFTYAGIIYSMWMAANLLGALFGRLIEDPSTFGFDFILPLYFIGLVMAYRKSGNFWPILLVSVTVSLLVWFWIGTPWHISLGGLAGLVLAAALSKPEDQTQTTEAPADV